MSNTNYKRSINIDYTISYICWTAKCHFVYSFHSRCLFAECNFFSRAQKIPPTILESAHTLTKEERIFEIFGHTLPKTIF